MAIGLGIGIGVLLGALGVWAIFSRRAGAQAASLEAVRAEAANLHAEREALRTERDSNQAELSTLRAENQFLVTSRAAEQAQLADTIANVTNEVVNKGTEQLSKLAAERFSVAATSLEQTLALRDEQFKNQVDPLKELLDRYSASVKDLETKRVDAYKDVTHQLERLQLSEAKLEKETRSLVTALRSPTTRGRWGELQLRRVVEMAGMIEHCDFVEQDHVTTDEGIQKPDLVVSMSDGARIVIDSKVPLDAYLKVIEAEDDDTRRARLLDHARQLKVHIDTLAKKAYWKQFEPESPEFVVCFVPGEALLAAAFEADPTLIDHALSNKVLLTGPTNLIALLKTVGLGWRHEALAENAREIQQEGKLLHERLATFLDHLSKVGRALNTSLGAYNQAVGSLESRVLPSARRFGELGIVQQGSGALSGPSPIEGTARSINAPEIGHTPLHPSGNGELHLVESNDDTFETED